MCAMTDRKASPSRARSDAVGIVVQTGPSTPAAPRAVAFVWGAKVLPAPSLPFGRWKPAVVPALG